LSYGGRGREAGAVGWPVFPRRAAAFAKKKKKSGDDRKQGSRDKCGRRVSG
jgi:hypothetical protein